MEDNNGNNDDDETNRSNNDTVYLGNIPAKYATEAVLEKLLQKYGHVVRISLLHRRAEDSSHHHRHHNKTNSHPATAAAFGQFSHPGQAQAAIQALDGRKLGGRILMVRPAHARNTSTSHATRKPANRTPQQQQQRVEARIRAIREQISKGKNTRYDEPK